MTTPFSLARSMIVKIMIERPEMLRFVHGTMTSGKTTALLQEAHNIRLHGHEVLLLTARGDTRSGIGRICSRIGISAPAETFAPGEDLFEKISRRHSRTPLSAVMVDEAQWLERDQVWQLSDVADDLGIRVSAYGLRSDFLGRLFEGSATLMALADQLVENTGICPSGERASMVVRIDENGNALSDGPQVMVGGEETYVAVSRKEWKRRIRQSMAQECRKEVV